MGCAAARLVERLQLVEAQRAELVEQVLALPISYAQSSADIPCLALQVREGEERVQAMAGERQVASRLDHCMFCCAMSGPDVGSTRC